MRFIIVCILCMGLLTACSNWKEEPAISRIIAVNALPGSGEVDFVYNGHLLQNQSFSYGDFTDGYLNLQAGRKNMTIRNAGDATSIIDTTLFLTEFRNYTAFLTRFKLKDTLIIYRDTVTTPTAGNARIRFVNMFTEDAGNTILHLFSAIEDSSQDTLFANRKFMNISHFTELNTASNYIFTISKNKIPLTNVSLKVDLNEEINYTILATDTLLQGTNSIKLNLIKHK